MTRRPSHHRRVRHASFSGAPRLVLIAAVTGTYLGVLIWFFRPVRLMSPIGAAIQRRRGARVMRRWDDQYLHLFEAAAVLEGWTVGTQWRSLLVSVLGDLRTREVVRQEWVPGLNLVYLDDLEWTITSAIVRAARSRLPSHLLGIPASELQDTLNMISRSLSRLDQLIPAVDGIQERLTNLPASTDLAALRAQMPYTH